MQYFLEKENKHKIPAAIQEEALPQFHKYLPWQFCLIQENQNKVFR